MQPSQDRSGLAFGGARLKVQWCWHSPLSSYVFRVRICSYLAAGLPLFKVNNSIVYSWLVERPPFGLYNHFVLGLYESRVYLKNLHKVGRGADPRWRLYWLKEQKFPARDCFKWCMCGRSTTDSPMMGNTYSGFSIDRKRRLRNYTLRLTRSHMEVEYSQFGIVSFPPLNWGILHFHVGQYECISIIINNLHLLQIIGIRSSKWILFGQIETHVQMTCWCMLFFGCAPLVHTFRLTIWVQTQSPPYSSTGIHKPRFA